MGNVKYEMNISYFLGYYYEEHFHFMALSIEVRQMDTDLKWK